MAELFRNSTGYRRLDLYILANIIQLETLVFCRRFLGVNDDPCGRQFDQMTQAARSGVKNITEGSERMLTSMQTTLKLLDVARASLCELRDDYLTYLMDLGEVPWRQSSPEAQEVFAVRLAEADYGDDLNHDVCAHIIAERRKFAPWFDCSRLQSKAVEGGREQSNAIDSNRPISKREAGVWFANALLIVIGRTLHMLSSLIARHGEEFVKEGGFSERMTAARVEEKRRQRAPVDDDAPTCPKCGGVMRLRHGPKGDFWGCTGYPACKGTREVKQ